MRTRQPFVTERWLGGTLTNFRTIRSRLTRLHELDRMEESGEMALHKKKEQARFRTEQKKLRKNLEARAVDKGEGYNLLRRSMNMQLYEARSAGRIAVRFVGGEYMHRDRRGDPNARAPLVAVDAKKQREALDFVCKELLTEDYYQFPAELLQKAAPEACTIIMVDRSERQYVEKLTAILPVHAVLQHPVSEKDIEPLLSAR